MCCCQRLNIESEITPRVNPFGTELWFLANDPILFLVSFQTLHCSGKAWYQQFPCTVTGDLSSANHINKSDQKTSNVDSSIPTASLNLSNTCFPGCYCTYIFFAGASVCRKKGCIRGLLLAFDGWSNVKKRGGIIKHHHNTGTFFTSILHFNDLKLFPSPARQSLVPIHRVNTILGENLCAHHLAVCLCDSEEMKNVLWWKSDL